MTAAARAFAAGEFGENWDYVLAAHDDTAHAHVHLLVNIHGMDGRAYRMGADGTRESLKAQTQEMRAAWASACRAQGIEMTATPRAARGLAGSSPSSGEWRATQRGEPLHKHKTAEERARREATRAEPSAGEERLRALFAAEGAAYQKLAKDMRAAAARGGYKDRTAEALAVAAEIEAFGRMAAAGEPSRAERLRRSLVEEHRQEADQRAAAASRRQANAPEAPRPPVAEDEGADQAKAARPEERAMGESGLKPHPQRNAFETARAIRAMLDAFRKGERVYAGGAERYVDMETMTGRLDYPRYAQGLRAHCEAMAQHGRLAGSFLKDDYRRLNMRAGADRLQHIADPKSGFLEKIVKENAEDAFRAALNKLEVSERMLAGGVNSQQAQQDMEELHARAQRRFAEATQAIEALAERGKTADIPQEEAPERQIDRGRGG